MTTDLAQSRAVPDVGSPFLNMAIFAVFVLVTLVVVFRVSRSNRSASDYYAAGRSFTGPQNGVAIAGDYLSAASFLGIAGAIAVNGYDGFLYSIGFLVAWLVALLLVAELLRNTGRFTMGDVLAFRMRQRPVRAGRGHLDAGRVVLLPARPDGRRGCAGVAAAADPNDDALGQSIAIAVVGILMIIYVLVGGMKGTTYVR
jgi:cation/acetate symporter